MRVLTYLLPISWQLAYPIGCSVTWEVIRLVMRNFA